MSRIDARLAAYGLSALIAGILVTLFVEAPALRLLGSLTSLAIGFGLLRQAFRLE